jgi:hypothetical protein
MLNALSNHSILPHSGRALTKSGTISAITTSLNLSPTIANIFTSVALTINPDHDAHSFDLDMVNKHGFIEHDVSLSRSDYALGDNHSFDGGIWGKVVESYGVCLISHFSRDLLQIKAFSCAESSIGSRRG